MVTYYISPIGDDSTGAGTLVSPWLTPLKAFTSSVSGDTIIAAAGTYNMASSIMQTARTFTGAPLSNGTPTTIFSGSGTDTYWIIGNNWVFNNIRWTNIISGGNDAVVGYDTSALGTTTFNNCQWDAITIAYGSGDGRGICGTSNVGGGTYILNNCLVYGCLTANDTRAGFIFQNYGTYVLNNVTVSFTSLPDNNMRLFAGGVAGTLKNCIVYNDSGKTVTKGGSSIVATYSDFYLITSSPLGTGVITSDPLFFDPANSNFHLRVGSPCRNTGSV